MERTQKERYPSFICIKKLPEFTNEIVSGLELKRSKTIMGYEQEIKNNEKMLIAENSSEPLLKNIDTNSSAFIPIGDNSKSRPDSCNLN